MADWRLVVGDCRTALAEMAADSVDAVVCDPPYFLNFMNKGWDKANPKALDCDGLPGTRGHGREPGESSAIARENCRASQLWHETWAREALRVLKPGGCCVAFGGSRTFHRLVCGLEDAGFEIRDTICWMFGSGFPKHKHALKPAFEPIVLARKPLVGSVAENVARFGTGGLNVDACRVGTEARVNGGMSSLGVMHDDAWRPREVSASVSGRWPANVVLDAWDEQVLRLRYNIPDDVSRLIRELYRDYHRLPAMPEAHRDVSEPSRQNPLLQPGVLRGLDQHQSQWRESPHVRQEPSTGIHPQDVGEAAGERQDGFEVPLMEGRPLSLARLRDDCPRLPAARGTGALRVDGQPQQSPGDSGAPVGDGPEAGEATDFGGSGAPRQRQQTRQPARASGSHRARRPQAHASGRAAGNQVAQGRERTTPHAPLYVLACDVPDGWRSYFESTGITVPSPDSAAALLDAQSGERASHDTRDDGSLYAHNRQGVVGAFAHGASKQKRPPGRGDTGGASRFFPTFAWAPGEVDEAVRFRYVPKASRRERNAGLEGMPERAGGVHDDDAYRQPGERKANHTAPLPVANHHPTVKPVALMRWLCRLVTPPGGLILDPFLGSGSTGMAALLEGFAFVGIEQDESYAAIAERRIAHVARHGERWLEMAGKPGRSAVADADLPLFAGLTEPERA